MTTTFKTARDEKCVGQLYLIYNGKSLRNRLYSFYEKNATHFVKMYLAIPLFKPLFFLGEIVRTLGEKKATGTSNFHQTVAKK